MKTESSSSYSSHEVSTSSSNNAAVNSSNNNSSSSKTLQEFGSSRVPLTLRDFFFQDPFFKNSWEDFEKIQKEMMRQSQEFWAKVRQDNANLFGKDLSITSSMDDNKFFEDSSMDMMPMFAPRRWMMPKLVKFEDSDKMFPADFFHFKNFKEEDQVLRVKDDDGKFELSLDTHEYRPDELKVNVNGNVLSVEAKHEEKSDGKFVSRQFSRKYTLPEGCEGHRVTSNLSSDGILMITAPKRQAIKTDTGARPIPIELKK